MKTGNLRAIFVRIARYDRIQELRNSSQWQFSDAMLRVVNDFNRQFERILRRAGVAKGHFRDLTHTAITSWFANGMDKNEVMVLAVHSNFAPTHEFYVAVTDDLVDRALGTAPFCCFC